MRQSGRRRSVSRTDGRPRGGRGTPPAAGGPAGRRHPWHRGSGCGSGSRAAGPRGWAGRPRCRWIPFGGPAWGRPPGWRTKGPWYRGGGGPCRSPPPRTAPPAGPGTSPPPRRRHSAPWTGRGR